MFLDLVPNKKRTKHNIKLSSLQNYIVTIVMFLCRNESSK